MAGMQINHTETSGIDDTTLQTHISRLSSYRDQLKSVVSDAGYNSPESVLALPGNQSILDEVSDLAETLNHRMITDVVVVGMGGSVRGSKAVFDLLQNGKTKNLHTIDTLSDQQISGLLRRLKQTVSDARQLAICVVSKSGQTAETVANANVLLAELSNIFPSEAIKDRFVVVSEPQSQLRQYATDKDVKTIGIPEQVSGRFSVFSAAGLLPLALAGIDITELSAGGKELLSTCLTGRAISDPAATLASILYAHSENNMRIINHFFFNQKARALGAWSEQLFAESLGKRTNKRGEPVFSGMYPVTSIGPDDLHANYQLQLAGPKNFITVFVRERDHAGDLTAKVDEGRLLPDNMTYIKDHSLGDLKTALAEATLASFRESNRPFIDISVPKFSTQRLGQFLLLEQLVVIYAGHLLNINTFNQPQVENYKESTKKYLTTS